MKNGGCIGLLKGMGRAIIGLPVKPIGGLFDFASKTLEGMLHSIGTGYTTQKRINEPVKVLLFILYNIII